MKNFIYKNKRLVCILCFFITFSSICGVIFYTYRSSLQTQNTSTKELEKEVAYDTTAPKVEILKRYLFTNNLQNLSFDSIIGKVNECSEWSASLIGYEKQKDLEVLTEKDLENLVSKIETPFYENALHTSGKKDFPSSPGIYRAVLEIADIYGNRTWEEIYVIYDTTAARIDDTPDKTITVEKEDLNKEPVIDTNDYTIIDNVDGKITSKHINHKLELRNAENHEWTVQISYTDRAGNESHAEFLITIMEKTTTLTNSDNAPSSQEPPSSSYSGTAIPADSNTDGVIDGNEASENYSPSEQAAIQAGYGVVILLPTGNYGILTHGDGYINGAYGSTVLIEYLQSNGLYAANGIFGAWIDSERDLYWYVAKNPQPLP